MKQGQRIFSFGRLALAAALFAPAWALAVTQAGVVLVSTGNVRAVGADGAARELVRRSPVYAGDRLVTASGARAQVKFTDGAIVGLKPNSELRIDKYQYEPAGLQASVMALLKGGFRTVTGAIGKTNKADYKVTTPVATIGIRGTLYDADYTPGKGLDLAVWDGGISACNSSGCLDLGNGADFRFGFVSSEGEREGRNEPEPDEPELDDGSAGGGDLDRLENDIVDEDMTLFLQDDTDRRAAYPLSGFATVASTQSNPWGLARTLDVGYARATVTPAGGVSDWSLQSATIADQFVNPGAVCGTTTCNYYLTPQHATLGTGGTDVVWGYWYGSDVSVGAVDGVPTDSTVFSPGVFVMGTDASPAVVGTMTGTTNFTLYTAPTFIDGLGYLSTSPSAWGNMSVNLDTGSASGSLQFATTTQASWNLLFDGTASTHGLDLAIVTDTTTPVNGSTFTPANAPAGGELAVQGTIDARFVGATAVDGVVGAFDVQTVDQTRAAQGTFIMQTQNFANETAIP